MIGGFATGPFAIDGDVVLEAAEEVVAGGMTVEMKHYAGVNAFLGPPTPVSTHFDYAISVSHTLKDQCRINYSLLINL